MMGILVNEPVYFFGVDAAEYNRSLGTIIATEVQTRLPVSSYAVRFPGS